MALGLHTTLEAQLSGETHFTTSNPVLTGQQSRKEGMRVIEKERVL